MSRLRIASKKHPEIDPVDLSMMERAIELARSAGGANEVPVGAVIYRGEEILAEAANNRETTGDPTGHAELVALRLAGERLGSWRLEGCSMAVTLEPCPMCAGALVNARLDRLVYGAFDRKAGACCSLFQIPEDRRLNHRVEMIGGVEEERCAELLRAFFRRRRAEKRQAG
ncbi:MAG: nucleoside deaminase [Phycisphaera sp.]|nr:nucleoside deaminase [Phycisphaera sp.]